ncbi:SKG3-like protein [Elsinoe fawcettii]|nr:SKG3-like protein [Elsinoe fawcettii]
MPRPRVLSFGLFGQSKSPEVGPSPTSPTFPSLSNHRRKLTLETASPQHNNSADDLARASPSPSNALQQRNRSESRASRPTSMIQTYSPATMDTGDTLPELQPIFTFLNSHSNKLYQEGYFLKLHDLDSRGRPSGDRTWTECFAQLVGTVLSLWDAAALDAAGEEGEVLPTFINLSDASIKMIESLPINGSNNGNLQNVLSISTAANNRYLLHFNSLNSLTQWTAGIRLAMYEQATLQEAYTGALIAGKGRMLNNIKSIMERSRFKSEDWARVRFGAGTPWRRCWCIISPPDQKEYEKMQKESKKNKYEKPKFPKGNIKFYDTRRVTKKTQPIATISDAYAAYAIYPQSKPLIDQSTLVKLEGLVTIHSSPETTTEGFIFVMPEVHPMVTGFEMMLRWLFPVWDTFCLYGRPNRLISDTLDQRGLMFALPQNRRYGYLDILDISGLIHTEGSQAWSERQWRSELKKLTSHRMNATDSDPGTPLRQRRNTTSRTSLPGMNRAGVRFDDDGASQSSPVSRKGSPAPPNEDNIQLGPRRAGTAPVNGNTQGHRRSVSDALNYKNHQTSTPSRLSIDSTRDDIEHAPRPPTHGVPMGNSFEPGRLERVNSEREEITNNSFEELSIKAGRQPLTPVAHPPAFIHPPSAKPASKPYQAPELRRATSEMDAATLHQMQEATHTENQNGSGPRYNGDGPPHEVAMHARSNPGAGADVSPRKEMVGQLRHPHQLPTIPGSPLPQQPQFQRPLTPNDSAPPPPQHTSPRVGGVLERRAMPLRTPSSEYATPSSEFVPHRKPVPTAIQSPPIERPTSRASSTHSSIGGFSDQIIDDQALEEILQNDRTSTMQSSVPDYDSVDGASIRSGRKQGQNVEKPRAGRLKTVGDKSMAPVAEELQRTRSKSAGRLDTFWQEKDAEKNGEMPAVNFGPTYTYKPSGRPGSRGALTSGMVVDGHTPSGRSSASGHRNSYFGGRGTPSPGAITPIDSAGPSEGQRRSMVWQPGAAVHGENTARQSLTPEQWVQHRASIASQPMALRSTPNLSSERRNSTTKRHSSTNITPPLSRHTSGDWGQQAQRTSPQPISRPASRNAGLYLQSTSTTNLLESNQPKNLTAREQMHVSRATGAPLVDLERKDPKKKEIDPNAGLYGALNAREREKAAIKKGYSSTTIQQAISSTQHQQYSKQQEQQYRLQQQFQMQQAQAIQAAQAAQYQAHMQQQQAYQNAVHQQLQHNHYQQQNQQVRPGMGSQRSSMVLDQFQGQGQAQPGAWNNAAQQQQQQQSQYAQSQYAPTQYAQTNRGSIYGGLAPSMYGAGYAPSTHTRPSPR